MATSRVARVHRFGGPEELKVETVDVPAPGEGQVLLRQNAAAVHFADILVRENRYFLKPTPPCVLGLEGAGVIEAVGAGVTGWKAGDRAAYMFNLGAYAERRLVPAAQLYRPPASMDDRAVCALFVRAMTAQYLLRRLYVVQQGETILVHSAAGGMGSLLVQWAKHLGATVIGTVGGAAKVATAQANGCDHVIDYTREDFSRRVLDITGGEGVPVLYEAVGKDVYEGNLACLRPRGWYVNYGNASGFLPPIDAMELNRKSLVFTKASLKDFTRTPAETQAMAAEVNDVVAKGIIKANITREVGLDGIAGLHADLGARKTTGAAVVVFA
ncbi:MAG: quinone oxidoreductase [Alphaproteobacteria bacterium]